MTFTKTQIAKMFVTQLVALSAVSATETVLEDHTNIDTERKLVKAGINVGGEIVADRARPKTDALVDKAISCYQTWRDNKNTTTETEK